MTDIDNCQNILYYIHDLIYSENIPNIQHFNISCDEFKIISLLIKNYNCDLEMKNAYCKKLLKLYYATDDNILWLMNEFQCNYLFELCIERNLMNEPIVKKKLSQYLFQLEYSFCYERPLYY